MTTAIEWISPPPGPPPAPRVPRHGMPAAIAVALTLSAAFAIGQVLFWAQPEIRSPLPWMRIFLLPEPEIFKLTRKLVYAGWGLAALLGLLLLVLRLRAPVATPAARARTVRTCQFGVLGALLLPFVVMPLDTLGSNPLKLLLCLPTTAVALLCVHRAQLFRRMPGWLLMTGFGWGALVGGGFGLVMFTWFQRYGAGYLLDLQHPRDSVRTIYTMVALDAGIVSELGKAAGVAVLFFAFRRHFDGVVSGVVIGAAVGLGFNLTETVRYMAVIEPGQQSAQFWIRQVVGLMAAHVAFTAVVGAGFGAARGLPALRDRLLVVGGGVLAAMGGHFATDAVMPPLGKWKEDLFSHDQTLGLLLGVPLTTATTSGVFVVLYVLILRRGLKAQAAGLARALRTEAEAGTGAVTAGETGLLLDPRRRLLVELRVWRRDGTAGLRHLMRLHQAQLDLATQRWHRASAGADSFVPDGRALRTRVLELKGIPPIPADPAGPAFPPAQEVLS
ncbi:PrsW family intramembrane metalloprotease [Streptomyces sp. ISL-11]|uniref:PrsW family intramembrane metalloprotease n=1 Tax=Streptomyces sp. ISL-11 TaxID=2819174 RepID=UPI001BEB9057|nr:PrsW family glutamic-type intramembrane protease [Streptomyces sp. ISL-11]MBT2384378.1 PrsW family intramembrane metalloprotease [Streptomyces sp. ISL-11]